MIPPPPPPIAPRMDWQHFVSILCPNFASMWWMDIKETSTPHEHWKYLSLKRCIFKECHVVQSSSKQTQLERLKIMGGSRVSAELFQIYWHYEATLKSNMFIMWNESWWDSRALYSWASCSFVTYRKSLLGGRFQVNMLLCIRNQ